MIAGCDGRLTDDGMVVTVGPAQPDLMIEDLWVALKHDDIERLRRNMLRYCRDLRDETDVPLDRVALMTRFEEWVTDNLVGGWPRTDEQRHELGAILHAFFMIHDVDFEAKMAAGLCNEADDAD